MAKSSLGLTHGKIHMNNIIGKQSLRWLAGGALMVFATLSHAQYVWLNEKGSRVYSDQAPPNSIPLKNIIKQPSAADKSAPAVTATPATPAVNPAPPAKAPPTLAEREADFKKRATERAEAEKKSAADSAQQAAERRNCEIARAQKAAMDAGEPVITRGANGERTAMSQERMAEERARNDKNVAACK